MANPEWANYKWTNYTPPPQRYCLLGDDSGHCYFVAIGLEKKFEEWVESFSDEQADGFKYEGPDFNSNRIDGTFTFTDPRCE